MKLGPYDENTIVCGDCFDVMSQMPDGCVDLVLTDPPYNTGKDYGDQVDDSRDPSRYLEWYSRVAAELYRVCGNAYLYVSCTVPQLWELRPVWERVGFSFQTMMIWHGPNYASNSNVIRGPWRLLYEPILMFLKGKKRPMLADMHGYNSDAVQRWVRPQRDYSGWQRRIHPAQKPIGLYRCIIARTPGELVFDPFVGAGTSAIAAKMLGRGFFGCDIIPCFVTFARERLARAPAMLDLPAVVDQPALL